MECVLMLTCNRLRIDPGHGSPVVEYRIENGRVESRIVRSEMAVACEAGWQQLTAHQISMHIKTDTVVAHWLHGRMGVHRLLRACTSGLSSVNNDNQGCTEHIVV
jgi:hypothetical protein